MSNLTRILKAIRSSSDSLAIFAEAANLDLLPSDVEQQAVMLENTLDMLARLQELHADLKQAITRNSPTPNTQSYTTIDGECVCPECLDWLENARYWIPADPADDTVGEWLPCSRYYIGEVDGDSASVWLNDDMQEVEV